MREAEVIDFNEIVITGIPTQNSASALAERAAIHAYAGSVAFNKIPVTARPGALANQAGPLAFSAAVSSR
jgi:hypothetical protein